MKNPHADTVDMIRRLMSAVAEADFNGIYQSEKDIYPDLRRVVKAVAGPENTRWPGDKLPPAGVLAFGRTCRPDGVVLCANGEHAAIEAKLITRSGSTDGIFHALIQGIVYSRKFAAALIVIVDCSGKTLIQHPEATLFEEFREHFGVWVAHRLLDFPVI